MPESNSSNLEYLRLLDERQQRKATNNLLDFIIYIKYDYVASWHHKFICDKLDEFVKNPNKKRLMLFVPPQHGKSEIASRCLPAYLLGRNPDLKIAACSYSIDLARMFNREVQRYLMTDEYKKIFPKTTLNSKNVVTNSNQSYLRNSEEFEVVGNKGGYKSVGVMGGLSGRTVDIAIIDDPVKDALEANSQTYRERVWEWYTNVLETRLHNKSKVILIMTRWHEDDLAGRLLKIQAHKWDVVKIPAIKEAGGMQEDPRQVGEPLWPDRHSLQKLNDLRALSERTFNSLYQQNPTIQEGDKVKRSWFQYIDQGEAPIIKWDIWIDGAYTKSTENDPTGLVVAGKDPRTGFIYFKHAKSEYMELPDLLNSIEQYCSDHGVGIKSRAFIEPKASGKSLQQMLARNKRIRFSPVEIKSPLVREGKEARIQTAAPFFESGRAKLIKGSWNEAFILQLTGFPSAKHDEYVDLAGYICWYYSNTSGSGVRVR